MVSGAQVSVRRRARGASGFTLVELLVAVTVMGMIVGPLTAAAEFFISHGQTATGQFADDTSVRSVISLFDTDAQSAEIGHRPRPGAVRICGQRAGDDDVDRRQRHDLPGVVVDADVGYHDVARSAAMYRYDAWSRRCSSPTWPARRQ